MARSVLKSFKQDGIDFKLCIKHESFKLWSADPTGGFRVYIGFRARLDLN